MRNLEKIDSVLTWIEEKILVYGILFMAVILIANVISRNFFYSSINASEEISQFLVVMVTFLGTSYAARKGLHIRMSILNDFLRGKPQKVLALFVSLITAFIMLYLACLAVRAGEADCAMVIGAEKMCVPQLGLLSSGDGELDTLLGLVREAA